MKLNANDNNNATRPKFIKLDSSFLFSYDYNNNYYFIIICWTDDDFIIIMFLFVFVLYYVYVGKDPRIWIGTLVINIYCTLRIRRQGKANKR